MNSLPLADAVEKDLAGQATDRLRGFRSELYRCLGRRADELFELTDALLCADGPVQSDAGDAHTLADLVRTDAHQLRPIAGDSPLVEGIKVIARAHQNLIWDRHRQMLRLRGSLREFFPAALAAWPDLTAPDAVELLAAAPDPERAARLSRSKIAAALRRARRRDVEARAEQIQATLRGRH